MTPPCGDHHREAPALCEASTEALSSTRERLDDHASHNRALSINVVAHPRRARARTRTVFPPLLSSLHVVAHEGAVAQERLDPCPLVGSRRGSRLTGWPRHDWASTARRPHTRRPVRWRSAARSASTLPTRSRSSASTSASGSRPDGTVSRNSTVSGIGPLERKKCNGRVARRGRPASSAGRPLSRVGARRLARVIPG
jgi:hypothetical protein